MKLHLLASIGVLLCAAPVTAAHATPLAPLSALGVSDAAMAVEAKYKVKRGHSNRGHHYGWRRGRGNPHRM